MIQNIVGPPIAGVTDLKSPLGKNQEKSFKGSGSDSFGKALEEKMSSKKDSQDSKGLKNERPEISRKESPRPERQEDRSSKLEARPEKAVTKQSGINPERKGAPSRQQAIKEFMDSFESEFEIPSTRLVDAMANLDDEQLILSPDDTAEAVVDQLGLSEADSERAQAMYAGLLTQLKHLEQAPEMPAQKVLPSSFGMAPNEAQLRSEAALNRRGAAGASVDRLNQQFWMKNPGANTQTPVTGFDKMSGDIAQRMMMDEASFAESAPEVATFQAPQAQAELPELPPHLLGQMNESLSPQLLAALAAKHAAAPQEQSRDVAEMSAEAVPGLEDFDPAMETPVGENKQIGKPMAENATVTGKMSQEQQFSQQNSQSQMSYSQNFGEKAMSPEKGAAQSELTAKAADFKQTMTGLEGLHSSSPKLDALKLDQAMPVAAAPGQQGPTPAQQEATVKSLMNQAQYLVKKGGGEVKVEMTPEGMGKIHLRVQLQDGKVNLQMSADTPEAKKTIESGLAELKTSLAAHKLSVDHVKVDVVSGPSTDTATQNQTNLNNGNMQQRDQARQFWNQFNENFGSQGRRDAYLQEGSNLRGYGRRQNADPLQPIETSSRKVKTLEGKGSGLNLVA
ncbi:Flagellar hook-length control protein FliK [compost metagenome]